MYTINTLLKLMIESKASDLFVSIGTFPMLKIEGEMVRLKDVEITQDMIKEFRKSLLTEQQQQIFNNEKELDLSYSYPGVGRFRVNCFTQRGTTAFVIHHIPATIKSINELNLPSILYEIALEERGFVLIVGSAGSGKSTSLAALIDYRNQKKGGHILTLEDPIEFIHSHNKSIVNQREIGQDSVSYTRALKSALREAPSVLLMGEIRDMDSITTAISLAETGHLVLSTMHATNTRTALERILNIHGPEFQEILRRQLSENLKAIIAQRLVPMKNGKLIPAIEVLLPSSRIIDLIYKGEINLIHHSIELSRAEGMQTFDQCLIEYYKEGKISAEMAVQYADFKTDISMQVREQEWEGKDSNIELDIEQL